MNKAEAQARLTPAACFYRGTIVGLCALQGLQLWTPEIIDIYALPLWARMVAGSVFVLMAANYLIMQRGFMLIDRVSAE